jgi:hypothetical protein
MGGQVELGLFQKNGSLVSNSSTVSWVVMIVHVYLGRVFGGLRFRH